ncbi:hypothetical protein [Streptomyces sp. NPDC095613]|uniref:Rv1733c family protein n=1 Tax=Streptomyces sp. NPDC095613 TaxID=3155540 RepID=UPI00332E9788
MRTIVGLWRWRHNPLYRGTDLAEAWAALTALLLLVLGAPAAGLVSGNLADATLRKTVREQHEQRHRTTAVVVGRDAKPRFTAYDTESPAEPGSGVRVHASWRAPDGGARTGQVSAPLYTPRAGDRFTLWTDPQGRPVRAPMNVSSARFHAVMAGIGTVLLASGVIEGGRRLVVWRLVQRRYRRLDQAWAQVGPDWGRTGAGS